MTDASDLDGILHKVQSLLARADSTTFPAEAEQCRTKAELLMHKYRIDAAMFRETHAALEPVWSQWLLCSRTSEYASTYWMVASAVLDHCGCEGVRRSSGEDPANYYVEAVGWEGDLRMAEMLTTSFLLAFGQRLEPKVDSSLPDQVNAYNLRCAGLEGRRIAEMLYGPGANTKGNRSKVRGMFVKEAAARGEDPKKLIGEGSVKYFRSDFASGFEQQAWGRLATMRRARGDSSGELVLASGRERVKEAFWTKFPQYRPMSAERGIPSASIAKPCEKCARAKSGGCNEHYYLRPSKARPRVRRLNSTAFTRGGDAARSVDLGPSSGRRLT